MRSSRNDRNDVTETDGNLTGLTWSVCRITLSGCHAGKLLHKAAKQIEVMFGAKTL